MKHWAEYEAEDPEAGWHAAGVASDRADALEADNDRLRTAITEALKAATETERGALHALCEVHAILSKAAAD